MKNPSGINWSNKLDNWRSNLNLHLADFQHINSQVTEETVLLSKAKVHYNNSLKAQQLVQEVAEKVQAQAHKQIASVVSRCLKTVFEETAYEFQIIFEKKRGKTEAKLVFVRDGKVLEDPLHQCGGGQVDIAAFGLRLACLMLSLPKKRRLVVLDEPFRHVKPPEHYGPKICSLIEELSEELGIQFIIIPSIEQHYLMRKVVEI